MFVSDFLTDPGQNVAHFHKFSLVTLKLQLSSTYIQVLVQLKSWNYGQYSMSITRYWVNPIIWTIAYQD